MRTHFIIWICSIWRAETVETKSGLFAADIARLCAYVMPRANPLLIYWRLHAALGKTDVRVGVRNSGGTRNGSRAGAARRRREAATRLEDATDRRGRGIPTVALGILLQHKRRTDASAHEHIPNGDYSDRRNAQQVRHKLERSRRDQIPDHQFAGLRALPGHASIHGGVHWSNHGGGNVHNERHRDSIFRAQLVVRQLPGGPRYRRRNL